MRQFWNHEDLPDPSSTERKSRIKAFFDSTNYDKDKKNFSFCLSSSKVVCESAIIQLLGLNNSPNISAAPGMWKRCRSFALHVKCGTLNQLLNENALENVRAIIGRPKFEHALNWIEGIADRFAERNVDGSVAETDVKILPFDSITSLFKEYEFQCDVKEDPPSFRASISWFSKAFNEQNKIRC